MEETIGERIAKLRVWAELSGRQTDKLAGTARCYTKLVESGVRGRHMTADVAMRYARAFGVSVQWIMVGEGRAPSEAAVRRHLARGKAA